MSASILMSVGCPGGEVRQERDRFSARAIGAGGNGRKGQPNRASLTQRQESNGRRETLRLVGREKL